MTLECGGSTPLFFCFSFFGVRRFIAALHLFFSFFRVQLEKQRKAAMNRRTPKSNSHGPLFSGKL
jgi:hypothetical protein